MGMIITLVAATWVCLSTVNPYADLLTDPVDSNTAFYAGDTINYLFPAPDGFRLVTDEAQGDGLSFAFVPEDQAYDTAQVTIGVTIYDLARDRTGRTKYADVVREDTTRLRTFYGSVLKVWPVDSMFCGTDQIVPTLYLSADKEFIPTVMVSYFNGGNEVVILELAVTEPFPRFEAEPIFERMVRLFRPLKKRALAEE